MQRHILATMSATPSRYRPPGCRLCCLWKTTSKKTLHYTSRYIIEYRELFGSRIRFVSTNEPQSDCICDFSTVEIIPM